MESFRSEIENPIVQKDIIELGKKIAAFRNNEIDEDRLRCSFLDARRALSSGPALAARCL